MLSLPSLWKTNRFHLFVFTLSSSFWKKKSFFFFSFFQKLLFLCIFSLFWENCDKALQVSFHVVVGDLELVFWKNFKFIYENGMWYQFKRWKTSLIHKYHHLQSGKMGQWLLFFFCIVIEHHMLKYINIHIYVECVLFCFN